MTRRRRLRLVVPVISLALVALALAACEPVKKTPEATGSCTQYWRGYVLASDHNYAGLGAYSGSDRYMCKETPTQGVRAQIQHLRNYADASAQPTQASLGNPFEPRVKYDAAAFMSFSFKGDAPRWIDLNGRWAVPGTTYGQTILGICNNIRAAKAPSVPAFSSTTAIMGASKLTAAQIASYVTDVNKSAGNTWKPEITPTQMAQLYLDEGTAANVRGDIAFCQSILETGWFSWPNSPSEVGTADATNSPYFEVRDATTARN
jgi:hypothetical protein